MEMISSMCDSGTAPGCGLATGSRASPSPGGTSREGELMRTVCHLELADMLAGYLTCVKRRTFQQPMVRRPFVVSLGATSSGTNDRRTHTVEPPPRGAAELAG